MHRRCKIYNIQWGCYGVAELCRSRSGKRSKVAKSKLDWFKLDCQLDDKFELIESEFGLKGFAIVVKLYQKIYGGEGYYCEWNDDVVLLFAKKNGLGGNIVSEIVDKCIQRGIFSGEMYEKYGILTSHGIQRRYYESTERRKFSKIRDEYLLLNCTPKTGNADISSGNVNIFQKNGNIQTTEKRRVEKKREDKSRVEKKREETALPDGSAPTPSPSLDQLIYDYGKENTDKYVQKVRKWYADKGKPISDLEDTVRKWLEQDGIEKVDHSMDKYKAVMNRFDL